MRKMLFIVVASSVCAAARPADKNIDEVARQWDAFSGKSLKTLPSGLAKTIDVDFDDLQGRVLLFMLPPSRLWGVYFPKEVFKNLDLVEKMAHIKSLGATDIIFNGGFSNSHGAISGRKGELAPRCYHQRTSSKDDLKNTAEACAKNGLGLWVSMHGLEEGRCRNKNILDDHASLYAKNANGEIYKSRSDGKGGPYDILSEEVFNFITNQIDDIIDATRPQGCFKGFFWDEFWFNYQSNYFGAYFDRFNAFCEKNFGEKPPAAVKKKFNEGGKWRDLNDKWWRRYVLWRETLIYQFEKKLVDYINKKGCKVINQRIRRGFFPRPYAWRFGTGMKSTEIGDWYVQASKQNIYTDNAIGICWIAGKQGLNNARMVTGRPACAFTYWYLEAANPENRKMIAEKMGEKYMKKYMDVKTIDRMDDEIRVLFRNIRRWDGARSLAETAVLMSDRGNIFAAKNPADIHSKNEKALSDALASKRPARIIDVELPEHFGKFNTIVTSGPALQNLDEKGYAALTAFLKAGGLLVAVSPEVLVGEPGCSQRTDKTAELFGIRYGTQHFPSELRFTPDSPVHKNLVLRLRGQARPLVAALDDSTETIAYLDSGEATLTPGITVRKFGKGAIIGIHFDLNQLILLENGKSDHKVFTNMLYEIIKTYQRSPSPVECEGTARIEECVVKDGAWAITLYGDQKLPATSQLKIASNILTPGNYHVVKRSRGVDELIKNKEGRDSWTTEELKKTGFTVPIDPERGYELIEVKRQ